MEHIIKLTEPFKENLVLLADSYKYSQPKQYVPGATSMYDYMEARGGPTRLIMVFGFQIALLKYLTVPITKADVDEAAIYLKAHGEPFEYDGWMKIVNEYNGLLPVRIKAIPEGMKVPTNVPVATIESLDEELFWLVGWLETFLMKVWYPIAVATRTDAVVARIEKFMRHTSDLTDASFMFHNFGDRASTCVEAAAIGGCAAAIRSKGTDNLNTLRYAHMFYDADINDIAYSIPASEHSSVTSWGKLREFDMMMHHLETFKKYFIVACVIDSYNVFEATDKLTSGEFKVKIESDGYPIFVLRPDSGNPIEVITRMLKIMEENGVQYTVNSKTLKVFKKYRILWGDGIDEDMIMEILQLGVSLGYAPDNFAFGSGGWLMQQLNRDTHKMAIKCSSITVNGEDLDVQKNPITDPGKASKVGKVTTVKTSDGTITSKRLENVLETDEILLITVYEFKMVKTYTFNEVRANAAA